MLFAEAGKDFVDMLFALLWLASQQHHAGTMHGSVGRLYKSVDDMDASHFLPNIDKDELLFPDLLPPTDESYVNGLATYTVTDGLEVTPMSAISGRHHAHQQVQSRQRRRALELAEKIVAVGDDEVRSSIGLQATPCN